MRKLWAVTLILILFNVIFFRGSGNNTYFFLPTFGTIGFLNWILGFNLFLFLTHFKNTDTKRQKYAVFASIVASILVVISVFRASWVDSFYLTMLSVYFTIAATYLLILPDDFFGATAEFVLMPVITGFNWLSKLGSGLQSSHGKAGSNVYQSSLLGKLKAGLFTKNTSSAVKGFLVSLPVIFIIIVLLTSADPIFSKFIRDSLNINLELPAELFKRVFYSVIFLFLVLPFLYMGIKNRFVSPLASDKFKDYHIQAGVLIGSITAVLGLFLVFQYKYLFTNVPETELIKFGINTFSEYVRKGFSELVIVSVIVYLAVGLSMVVYRSTINKKLKFLNLFLLTEMLLFIFSIFRRVFLYADSHGLTRVRVYGSIFLVLMIFLTIVMILRHYKQIKRDWYKYEIGFLIFVAALTGLMNVDGTIASYFHPTVNGEIDYVYITRLSPDAVDGWIDALAYVEKEAEYFRSKEGNFTQDDARRINYVRMVLNNIGYNYKTLAEKYGNESEFEDVKYMAFAYTNYVRKPAYSLMQMNLAEKSAYTFLKTKLDKQKIRELNLFIDITISALPDNIRYLRYDRSFDSPLL